MQLIRQGGDSVAVVGTASGHVGGFLRNRNLLPQIMGAVRARAGAYLQWRADYDFVRSHGDWACGADEGTELGILFMRPGYLRAALMTTQLPETRGKILE